ncbi:MAG: DNA-3-methyladenine glycosylase [Terriglobales bacterium]|jgi:DNA-3-methyladenine glycosylase II
MRKAINHLRKSDPVLAEIIERIGPCKMAYRIPEFENLARSIVYQQLNGKAASTIFARLEDLAGRPITPEGILAVTAAQMRAVGLSKQKLSYIRDLATKTHNGTVQFARLAGMKDEEVIEHLTQIKGIGTWTAHMFLMFALRRPNVLPTGDYGVQTAIKKAYKKRKLPKPAHMEKLARAWQPYRSVACWYLWRSLDVETL